MPRKGRWRWLSLAEVPQILCPALGRWDLPPALLTLGTSGLLSQDVSVLLH